MTLTWVANDATSFKVTSSPSLPGLPSGITRTSVDVLLPANTGTGKETYTFTITATGSDGTSQAADTVLVTVEPAAPAVNPPSIASFTASPSSLPSGGGTVNLAWTGSNVVSYAVTSSPSLAGLPGGTTATSSSVTVPANTSNNARTYTFTLTATGGSGTTPATQSTTVTVDAQPTSGITSFSASPTSLPYSGGTVSLTWSGTNVSSYSLSSSPSVGSLPTNTTSTGTAVSIPANTTSSDETYTFTLTATTSSGTDTRTVRVTVAADTRVSITAFTANPTSLPSSGGSVTLSWSANNATSYSLTSSPALSGLPTGTASTSATVTLPTNTSSSQVTYTFTLTATGASGSDTQATSVTVDGVTPPPSITAFSANPSRLASSGGSVTLSWSATGATSYTVTSSPTLSGLPTNTASTSATVSIPANTTASAVTYALTLTATGAGGTSTQTTSVQVDPSPASITSFTASPTSLPSSGGSVALSWSATNASSYTVTSSPSLPGLPTGTTATGANVSLPANTSGSSITYTFTLTASGASGTSPATATASVTVAKPISQVSITSFSASPTSLTYSGGNVTLSWSASNATSYTVTSSPSLGGLPSGTTATSATVSVPANSGGSSQTYTFTLTASGSGGASSDTATSQVTEGGAPGPTVGINSPSNGASLTATSVLVTGYAITALQSITITRVVYSLNGGGAVNCSGTTGFTCGVSGLRSGSNTIQVRATDSNGKVGSASVSVSVDTPPVASLSVSPNNGYVPTTVSFNACSSTDDHGIVGYAFDAGDGIGGVSSLGCTFSYTYTATGNFTASVTVTDSAGQTDTATQTVAIRSRTISFGGYTWNVRGWGGGPGNGNWSNDPSSVWVDSTGLHLKIRQVNGVWYQAEVDSQACFGYGIYRFYPAARFDTLKSAGVTTSFFNYRTDTQEIDLEFGGTVAGSANSQYVVQPGYLNPSTNVHTFNTVFGSGDWTTQYFNWQPGSVFFKSMYGHVADTTDPTLIIDQWTSTSSDIPSASANLRPMINLWLNGSAPTDGVTHEITVSSVDLPAGPYSCP